MLISPTASAALAANERLAVRHILDYLACFRILYKRSGRNKDFYILAVCTVELCTCAVLAVFSNEFSLIAECKEGI